MTDPVCIECDKKTQKDLPANDNLSSKDMSCEKEYSEVTSCMNRYEGQISSYTDQWNSFRLCHDHQKRSQWRSSVCVCVCEVIWSNVIFPSAQKWRLSIGLKLVWITVYIYIYIYIWVWITAQKLSIGQKPQLVVVVLYPVLSVSGWKPWEFFIFWRE